jgi:hypothetical protein
MTARWLARPGARSRARRAASWALAGLWAFLARVDAGAALAYTIPYEEARASGAPHECLAAAPSFFGETVPYRIFVRGADSHAVEAQRGQLDDALDERPFAELLADRWRHNAVLRDGTAYTWRRGSSMPPLSFDPEAVTEASEALHGESGPWKNLFLLVEPGAGDRCRPVADRAIEIPDDLDFQDATALLAAQDRQAVSRRRAAFEGLPFRPLLLPEGLEEHLPEARAWLSTREDGVLEKSRESVGVEYRTREDGELRVLQVSQRLAGGPASDEAWCSRMPATHGSLCREETVTPLGRRVSSRPDAGGRRFFFTVGSTEVSFLYTRIDLATGHPPRGEAPPCCAFADTDLAGFVDSFREVETTRLETLPPYE